MQTVLFYIKSLGYLAVWNRRNLTSAGFYAHAVILTRYSLYHDFVIIGFCVSKS